jgi:hypothetical protein
MRDRAVGTLERVGELVKGEDVLTVWRWGREGEVCGYFVVEGGVKQLLISVQRCRNIRIE